MPTPNITPADAATKKVILTGGAGFLGRFVQQELLKAGFQQKNIFIPRRKDTDLTDQAQVARLYRTAFPNAKADLVIHLAAEVGGIGANRANPGRYFFANMAMALHLIEQGRLDGLVERGGKFVQVGTICAYPKFTPVPFKEDELWNGYPEETNAPYGVAKLAQLTQLRANRDQYGQSAIYLMPTNLYGPGDKFNPAVSHVIPALIKKCVDAKEAGDDHIDVWGTGTASREFLYVDDAANAVVLAAERYDEGEPVNLGTDEEMPIRDLVEVITELVGFTGEVRWDTSRPDGQPRRRVDPSRARKYFGFEASVSFRDGLRRTIDWYLTHRDEAEARST